MKSLTASTLAVLMALSTPALAEKELASCEQIAGLAESMMSARQSGVSMVDAMGTAGDSAMIEKMVIDAYEVHRFKAPVWQESEVADFRDKYFMACYKSRQGN